MFDPVAEFKAIKEKQGLETAHMTVSEMKAYYKEGADRAMKEIKRLTAEKAKQKKAGFQD